MTFKELEKEAEEWAKDRHYYNGTVKGYVAERDNVINAYLTGAEPREKQITELETQLEREKNLNQCMTDNNEQLRELIEKMKCCGNCENGELSAHEEPCRHCQRCFASKDVTDQENVKDNWEVIKEIKEK